MKVKLQTDDRGATRCSWCGSDPLYLRYHDREWGKPVKDDHRLFEKLCLEGFQSGLSWLTILKKRENFRNAFKDFDPARVARFHGRSVERLLQDAGIVRHRGKIESVINNARRYRELAKEEGSLASFVWRYEPGPRKKFELLAKTPESTALSKELKKRGWSFVGPTTVYAFMQSMGMVNDHFPGCDLEPKIDAAREKFRRP